MFKSVHPFVPTSGQLCSRNGPLPHTGVCSFVLCFHRTLRIILLFVHVSFYCVFLYVLFLLACEFWGRDCAAFTSLCLLLAHCLAPWMVSKMTQMNTCTKHQCHRWSSLGLSVTLLILLQTFEKMVREWKMGLSPRRLRLPWHPFLLFTSVQLLGSPQIWQVLSTCRRTFQRKSESYY